MKYSKLLHHHITRITILIFIFIVGSSFTIYQSDQERSPEVSLRAKSIYKNIRCLTCKGETVYNSVSPFAAEVKSIVLEMIISGKTDQEILEYMKNQYGETVLVQNKVPTMLFNYIAAALFTITIIKTRKRWVIKNNTQK